MAAGGTSPTGRLPWSTGNCWQSSCLSSRTAPRENGGRRGTLDPLHLEPDRENGHFPQTSPIPVSRRPGERRDTRNTDPRHRSQVLLSGGKSCEARRAPVAPASQGNPGDGVTLGTVELWYFGYHGGRCKRRLCPRAGGRESRKKESVYLFRTMYFGLLSHHKS